MAPIELASARLVVQRLGAQGLDQLRASLPDKGRRLHLAMESGVANSDDERTLSVSMPDGRTGTLVYRLVPDQREPFDLLDTLYRSTDYLLASLFGGIVFAAVLAFYMIRPVRRLRDGFDALADGDLTVRLGPGMGKRRDEVADLARYFDRMAIRLEQLVTVRDQLLHDVSHELRSPLARLTLAVALLRRTPAQAELSTRRIEEEIARLDELVAELLSLARSESGANEQETYFDLTSLLEAVVSTLGLEAGDAGVDIVLTVPTSECVIRGSSELMRRAIENVLRNAIRLSHSGTRIATRLMTSGDQVHIVIEDQGPGVPTDLLERIFEPFHRGNADRAKRGYGLGLTIAKRAILSHHGTITARNVQPTGLAVAISLPIAPTGTLD